MSLPPGSSHHVASASSGIGQLAMHEAELAGLHQAQAGSLLVGDHNNLLNNMTGGNLIYYDTAVGYQIFSVLSREITIIFNGNFQVEVVI